MGVQVDNYFTTSFVLRDQRAVDHIKHLCELLNDEQNLSSGYLSEDAYCDMYSYSSEENSFKIKTGGYIDSGPELKYTSVYGFDSDNYENEYEQNEMNDCVYLFQEIKANLKEGTWFFVDGYSWDKGGAYTSVQFYHQDGRSSYVSNFDVKKQILKEMNI
jgi:hypothetical protein